MHRIFSASRSDPLGQHLQTADLILMGMFHPRIIRSSLFDVKSSLWISLKTWNNVVVQLPVR